MKEKNYIEVKTSKGRARLYKGRSLLERPKSYQPVCILRDIDHDGFNWLALFKTKRGLRYGIYKENDDKSYSLIYGLLEFIE